MDPFPFPPEIGRRSLLRAAGVGAGAMAASGVLGATTASATAPPRHRAAPADPSTLPLVGGEEFPIGLFWPPPPFQTTVQRYQEIADTGINFVVTGNYLFDHYIGAYALGMADAAGLKVLIAGDQRLVALSQFVTITEDRTVPSSINRADATSWLQTVLSYYTGHPSFVGLNIYDEPPPERLPTAGAATDIMREIAPTMLPYSNLYPGNGPDYAAFVQSYIDAVKPSLISFDRYPILTSGIDLNYFDNWVIFRNASLRTGLPAWTYIQSIGYNGHRTPNLAELRWQVNISLAYGCKGIQYFTWWTPDPARGEGFQPAIITVDGRRTALYNAARTVNTSWLRPVGRELKPLVSDSVVHANDIPLPPSVTAFTPTAYLRAVTGGAVVLGTFRSAADDGTRWLLVANRSEAKSVRARITLDTGKVRSVARFRPGTGTYVGQGHPSQLAIDLAAGDAVLYRLGV